MKKLSTIQKRNNLNEVYRVGDIGPGGAYHQYNIVGFPKDENDMGQFQEIIRFQKGPRSEKSSVHGVLDSDLLEIVRDRLCCFQQGEYATRENEMALRHIEEALMWMNKRAEDRAERGVLGTYEK